MDNCENSCEYCNKVNRSTDEYCHFCYSVSERCPIFKTLSLFLEINGYPLGIELVTRHTGCRYFEIDEEYKKQNEETDKLISEMNRKRGDKHAKYYPHARLSKDGSIMHDFRSWPQSHEEVNEVLKRALCINTASLARLCGVPENEVYECKSGSIAATEHNLKKAGEMIG